MGIIAFFTWQATDRAAIASKAAADIAARQQNFQERQQRARLSVTDAKLVPSGLRPANYSETEPVQLYRLEMKIKNSGGFPGRNVHLAVATDSFGTIKVDSQNIGTIENGQELTITSRAFDASSEFDSAKIAFAFSLTDDGSGKCAVSLPQQGQFMSVGQNNDQPPSYEIQFQGINSDELRPSNPAIPLQTPASRVMNEVQQQSGSTTCSTS